MAYTQEEGYQEAIRLIKNWQPIDESDNFLYFDGLNLTKLPEEISELSNLKAIGLANNQFSEFPRELLLLKNLEYIFFERNRLEKLPSEIGELENLGFLNFAENKLTELPDEISKLKKLQTLYVNNNHLRLIPKKIGELQYLTALDLSVNQLIQLPEEIKKLNRLSTFYVQGNPELNIPPEIVGKSNEPQTILNYYFENVYHVKEEDVRPLKEVKVLIVGQGRVGKTSLVKYLIENEKCNPEEPSTHGIIRNKWTIDVVEEKTNQSQEVQLNIWDFGGQDIQHQTHQFFLNQRSLYLLILDAGRDEAGNKLDYWLKKIQTVGKEAPILVAANKSEASLLPLDYTELKKNFNIKGFFNISCETGREIEELRQAIKSEIGKIEQVFEPIRKEWFAVKEHLENLEQDYISRDDYRRICNEKGVTDEQSQDTLLILLHELGVMLNFKEHDTEVINPEWVTRGVYQVVTSLEVQMNGGILTPDLLHKEITKLKDQLRLEGKEYLRYPVDKYPFITDLMKKFELAYQIDDTENYFIPSLLPKDSPYVGEWNEKESLGFRYNYENGLLHETIISRFIVKMNQYILQKTQWLTGVLLMNPNGNKALVKADLSNNFLTILVDNNQSTRREFLDIIRDRFRDIHKDFRPVEEVPLKDFPNVFVNYELLLQLEKGGIPEQYTMVDGKLVKYNVQELLNSVSSFDDRKIERETKGEEIIRKEKSILQEPNPEEKTHFDVALSFAGEDREFVQGVYEELDKNNISVFYDADEEIAIDLWGEVLIETLDEVYRERSKCVVMFVSENYERKIWTKLERRSALIRALEEKRVYVLPARFDNTELSGLYGVAFVDLNKETPQTFAQKIIRKLGKL